MERKFNTGLLCVATLVLAGCGGSSGGGSASVTPDDTTSDSNNDTPTLELPTTSTPPNDEPQASAGDRICTSHTPTTQSTIGNSVLVFDASPGQCFGVKQAMGSGKRLIQTDLIQNTGAGPSDILSAEAQGRLTINPYEGSLGDGVSYTFIIDVTNTGSEPACVESPLFGNPYANILDAEGEQLGSVRMQFFGDQYQTSTTDTPDVFFGCIPAGETRAALGSWTDVDAEIAPEIIASYDHVELPLTVQFPGADAVRAADLSPGELSWTASALEGESDFLVGTFDYAVTASVLNPSNQNVVLESSLALLAYLDSEGFLTDIDVLGVGDHLGLDFEDLTPEILTIAPSGGMLTYAYSDGFFANRDGRPDGYRGPATRALVHVERCFDEGCS